MLGNAHYASIGVTLLVISMVGVYSTRLVKSSGDFIVGGRKLGAMMVFAGIVGAFAGGTVTIGTAQMAYRYGISGLWFTLGAGAACLLLSLFLARPLREKGVETISQYMSGYFGAVVAPWVAVFTVLGMFIQMTVQMLASVPLLTSMFPIPPLGGLVLFAFLSVVLVVGGGYMGAALVGMIKLSLLTVTLFIAGAASLSLIGGMEGMKDSFTEFPWFSMFPRGVLSELAGGASVVVGFTSTQSFLQPLFAGKNVKAARWGSFLAALSLPCFGAAGVAVGMYMRTAHPDIDPAAALPLFMTLHQPAWIGGLGVATLLVSLLLTSSALALGIATLLSRDIYLLLRPGAGDKEQITVARLIVFVAAGLSCIFSFNILGDLILDWTYLSNALRGVTVFLPLMGAVFLSGRLSPRAGIWAVTVPPLLSVAWTVVFPGILHPLYIGLSSGALIMAIGVLRPEVFDKGGKMFSN
ncbi:MAG: sodium:solute symporter family protein [Bacillota bacterium]